MYEDTKNMLDRWFGSYGDDEFEIDMLKEAQRLSLDIIGHAAFGIANIDDYGCDNYDLPEGTSTLGDLCKLAFELSVKYASSFQSLIPFSKHFPTRLNRQIRATRDALSAIARDVVAKRRQLGSMSDDEQHDLLDYLLKMRDASISDDDIISECVTFIIAGHETTSNTLSWSFYLLTQHPGILDRCRAEVDSVLSKGDANIENSKNLSLIGATIAEALRLWPPVPGVIRYALEDAWIGSGEDRIFVPKGTDVSILCYSLHHNKKYWDDPETFNPDRWLVDDPSSPTGKKLVPLPAGIPQFAYAPFSKGTRTCVGQTFAVLEARMIIAMILQRYDVSFVPGQKIVPKVRITTSPRHGVLLKMHRRSVAKEG
jgi:cytochrome P450